MAANIKSLQMTRCAALHFPLHLQTGVGCATDSLDNSSLGVAREIVTIQDSIYFDRLKEGVDFPVFVG